MLERSHFTWVGPYCPALVKPKDDIFLKPSEELVRKLGYEFQITEVTHPSSVEPSGLLIDGNINEPLSQRLIHSVCFVVSLDVLLVTGTGCRRTRVKLRPFFAR